MQHFRKIWFVIFEKMVNEFCYYLYHTLLQIHIHMVEIKYENFLKESFGEEAFSSINIMRWGDILIIVLQLG